MFFGQVRHEQNDRLSHRLTHETKFQYWYINFGRGNYNSSSGKKVETEGS